MVSKMFTLQFVSCRCVLTPEHLSKYSVFVAWGHGTYGRRQRPRSLTGDNGLAGMWVEDHTQTSPAYNQVILINIPVRT